MNFTLGREVIVNLTLGREVPPSRSCSWESGSTLRSEALSGSYFEERSFSWVMLLGK